MKTGFIHVADVHLGTEQYGSLKRADDFGRQWVRLARWAKEHRDEVSMVLVSGDLFNRYNVDPKTYAQAREGLRILKQAGIPVLDVEGNHDRFRRFSVRTWHEVLAGDDLLNLLDVAQFKQVGEGPDAELRCDLVPLDREAGLGSYVDLDGVRVVGVRYLGAFTPRAVDAIARGLDDLPKGGVEYTILMLHGGVEGIIPQMNAELRESDLAKLEGRVDYLALGHIHKHYQHSSWVWNPGSLDTWRADEAAWPHGFLHVSVDTALPERHVVQHRDDPRRRKFLTIGVDVSECASPTEVYQLARARLDEYRQRFPRIEPVVHVRLEGTLRFERRDIDHSLILSAIDEVFTPVARKLSDFSQLPSFALTSASQAASAVDRRELALSVLTEINRQDERYRDRAEDIARLAMEAMSRAGTDAADAVGQMVLERWRALRGLAAPEQPEPAASSPVAEPLPPLTTPPAREPAGPEPVPADP
jgi:DNA repair exonuclease SbcCD nuclease subunit